MTGLWTPEANRAAQHEFGRRVVYPLLKLKLYLTLAATVAFVGTLAYAGYQLSLRMPPTGWPLLPILGAVLTLAAILRLKFRRRPGTRRRPARVRVPKPRFH